MAFRWRANDGLTLNAGLVALWSYRGSGPVLLSNPLFLAHQSRRLKGELIVYQSLCRPSVRASVRPSTFSNIFSETTGPIKLKFHMETLKDAGTKVCSNGFGAQLIGPIQLHVKRQNSSICNFFPGHCLDFFSAREWQDLSFTYPKNEKTTYLDNLVFSAFSVL